jgi:hypothetical protein
MNNSCYEVKLIRIQKLRNIKIAKNYRTVSNEALCVITGLIPIKIKIEKTRNSYEITKEKEFQYEREMEVKNWNHPAKHVKIIEGNEDSNHFIQAYTDGSKNGVGVGFGIAIFSENKITAILKYRLHRRCSNKQAEQLAILKALKYIQESKAGEKQSQCILRAD